MMSNNLNSFVSFGVSYINVCYIALTTLFFVVVVYIIRPASVLKFIEHVVGLRTRAPEQTPSEPSSASTSAAATSSKENPSSKKSKTQQKVKKSDDPVFSTNLSTPIEEVIKESIKEDLKSKSSQPSTSKKKGKPLSKPNQNTTKGEEKPKSIEATKSDKSPKKKLLSKPKDGNTHLNKAVDSDVPVDEIGFSFFPVKEKAKAAKKNKDTLSPVAEIKKPREDLSKPSIIDHYKKRDIKRSPETTVASKKSVSVSVQTSAVTNTPEKKLQLEDRSKTEVKESKKVCSSVSYANVVTNNIPEPESNPDINPKLEEALQKEQINTITITSLGSTSSLLNSDTESANQSDEAAADEIIPSESKSVLETENIDTNKEERQEVKLVKTEVQSETTNEFEPSRSDETGNLEKEFESNSTAPENLPQIIHFENLSKSESSSIEVICEEQNNIDFQSNYLENLAEDFDLKQSNQTQFGIIEENLNKLVESTEFDHTFCDSNSSSIFVIDSHTDSLESEIYKKETQLVFSSDTIQREQTIEKSDSLIDSTTNLYTENQVSNWDTFLIVERESDPNGYIETKSEKPSGVSELIDNLVEQISDASVKEEEERFAVEEDYCILEKSGEKSALEPTYFPEIEVADNPDIIEELQEFEKPDSLISLEIEKINYTFDISNDDVIEHASQEELIVSHSEVEHQEVEIKKIYTEESDTTETNITSNINIINEEFLQSEKIEETESKLDFEEIHNSLNDIQSAVIQEHTLTKTDSLHIDQQEILDAQHLEEIVPVEEKAQVSEGDNQEVEMASSQIRVLTLNDKEHQECTLYRIEKNWAIQFRLGPSLFGRKVYLYCNYSVDNKGTLAEFNRDQYQLLSWVLDEGCKNADDTAVYTQIIAKLAGSFHYYFTFEKGDTTERQGSGFFLVDPILKYGNNEDLPLDCIQCQTVLSKSLGSFSTWESKLQVAKEAGYNMIHFTPVQELGASNSSYSLSEQLKLNPVFKKENGKMPTFEEIKGLTGKIRKNWKVTSICDIVLNHTANESEWIKVHPEVTYNCVNCPYMRPAYLLDAAFYQFSMDIKKGLYEDKGIPTEVDHEDHLNAIRYHFRKSVLEPLKIEDLFICDTNKLAAEFFALARSTPPVTLNFKAEQGEIRILQDEGFKRLAATVDMTLALKLYNVYRNDSFDEDSRLKRCTEEFKSKLDSLNNAIIEDVNDHLVAAIENVIAGIRYFRVQSDGPRVKEISIKNPLVYRYFTDFGAPKSIEEHEEVMYSNNGRFLMAHNGWVMNSDPLKNFAAPDSNVYLRRELIAWGDSVKLRYGDGPKDCPFLWQHMKKYVEQTAEIFDGVRLDNCHSTPIPVAEYLLDCARRVRPDLYVVAELFTNSDMTDNIFVNRLGITSLIREAMSAWDSHEQGRLVYRYGGSPVGSFYQPRIRPLVPSIAHALFLDLTHDNPSPVEKRSVFDLLPSTALVNMACCASGSNRGYDELVPHHIHVVDEIREYTEWTDDENLLLDTVRYASKKSGIILAKKAINDIHFTLGKEGYNQVYVDQMDPDIVAVTRHRPDTHESYILVAFTAFGHPNEDVEHYQRGIKPLRFEGVLDEIVLEATLSHVSIKNGGSKFAKWENFVKDSQWVNGIPDYEVALKQHIQAHESDVFEKVDSGTTNVTQLNFKNFKPGSVVVIKASLPETMKDAVKSVRSLINQFSLTKETELSLIIDKLSLADLNRIIYRCDQEERDEGFGFDTYHIPSSGFLVYAGLQGFISLLANIRPNNDLGHPMCGNLRDGNWMIEYIWKRLKLDVNTRELGQWIEENTKFFNNIPRYLVPSYFDVVVTGLYVLLMEQCYKLMSSFVNHGSTFVRGLSLGSVQFSAYIKSADLPILSPNLAPPKPPTRKNEKGESVQACVSLSAGLPHFSIGYMRNWGRDTFIALRGLFILTGRFEEARQHILGYAACLRHGLIPNLLDGGRNSRFNCRDAVWWWLYCIKEYVEEAPNGINILTDKVSRIFPTDDSPAQLPGAVDQPLYDVIQESLKVHFQGLNFRERNAGRQIDEHMTDKGFNNQIGIHPETGFVFGGNGWNCGTWMDKMGSSDKAGNRGKPATPRDGSAVELIGLSKAVITWLWKLNQNKKYPYSGVERTHKTGSITKWTFKEWSDKIQANFEKYFWINTTPAAEEYRSDLINKRGIYKDCFGASQEWTDFQLRCNFPIAMVVAPELFTPQQAWTALKQAEKYLLGPLGMKTLDPEDWAYHGDYDNSNDSNDPSVANGFNYHQGPEWVWPVGFFLRAKLHFASLNGALPETLASTKLVLSKHFTELQSSVWRGLPELTNSNGSYCHDSSRTQAWSMSCVLEVLRDLQKIESNQPVVIN